MSTNLNLFRNFFEFVDVLINTMKTISKRLGIILILILSCAFALAKTYRDQYGNRKGSATTFGNTTTYRDQYGNRTGSATTNGNTTTYRDQYGNRVGTATKEGNQIVYRDKYGNRKATASE